MKHQLETRIRRAELNVKRATRRLRPKAKRKLKRLRLALDTWKLCDLMVRARQVGIEPMPGETYRELRRRVLLQMAFAPKTERKCEWKGGVFS